MPKSPRSTLNRINTVTKAWETLAPAGTFAGLTLAQFKNRVKSSLDARDSLANLDDQCTAAIIARDDADKVSQDTLNKVVSAIKGDVDHGEDSALYEAMGYVRRSNRKSGLRRVRKATTTPP